MSQSEDYLVVYLPASLWNSVLAGDPAAIEKASEMLDGEVIYDHVFSPPEEWGEVVAVSLPELQNARVIRSVTLHRDIV